MIAGQMHEIRFDVEELACNFCARRIFDSLSAIDGVVAVHVQPPGDRVDGPDSLWGTVVVKFVPSAVDAGQIFQCVRKLGYAVRAPSLQGPGPSRA